MKLAAGLMSGTSADGISIALAAFEDRRYKLLHQKTFPYPAFLSKKIIGARFLKTPQISELNIELGIYFANALQKFLKTFRLKPSEIAVVGSHGQTIYHGPEDKIPNTLQIGEPCVIAEKTGIPVVADFRARDIAAGGQGAPLIPFFDEYYFGARPRAMQNIGGIANVSFVGVRKPFAFDNGPGNCLIDWTVQKLTKGKKQYDASGKMAAQGKVNEKAILAMSRHPYFQKSPPKSTGRELFNESFIPLTLKKERPENRVATLTHFTARTIYESYKKWVLEPIDEVIVSGGGALNKTLMNHLKNLFSKTPVRSIEEFGIPVQAKEPMAFAFFALRAIEGKINHAPGGTGAKRACILGKIIPGTRS